MLRVYFGDEQDRIAKKWELLRCVVLKDFILRSCTSVLVLSTDSTETFDLLYFMHHPNGYSISILLGFCGLII